MVQLEQVSSESEAHIKRDYLLNHGIICAVLGAKDYASIVVGGDGQGRYRLMVTEQDLDRARQLLRQANMKPVPSEKARQAAALAGLMMQKPQRHSRFKKAIMYAIAAPLILPIVFNYASLKQGWLDWEESDQGDEAKIRWGLIILAQLPTLYAIKMMADMIKGMLSMF